MLDTCAADGSCQLACPVGIDTGAMVKELRAERHTGRVERAALAAAKRWGTVESASRTGMRVERAGGEADAQRAGAAGRGAGTTAGDDPRGCRRGLCPVLHQPDF